MKVVQQAALPEKVTRVSGGEVDIDENGIWTKYIHEDVKWRGNGATAAKFSHHRDHLASIKVITDEAGIEVNRTTYASSAVRPSSRAPTSRPKASSARNSMPRRVTFSCTRAIMIRRWHASSAWTGGTRTPASIPEEMTVEPASAIHSLVCECDDREVRLSMRQSPKGTYRSALHSRRPMILVSPMIPKLATRLDAKTGEPRYRTLVACMNWKANPGHCLHPLP